MTEIIKTALALTGGNRHSHNIPNLGDRLAAIEARLTADEARIAKLETPVVPPPPPPPPTNGASAIVASITELKNALLDDTLGEVVLRNGTYHVSGASYQNADSLWIGQAYAARTRPVLVRAESKGGVVLDGGGANYFGGLTFHGGAHDQTWDGFRFANGEATATGIIVFGGPNEPGLGVGAHHITLRNIGFDPTCHGYAWDPTRSNANDVAIYMSDALGVGHHDIVFDGIEMVCGTNPLHALIQWYDHGFATPSNVGHDFVMRNVHIRGTNQGILMWAPGMTNALFEDILIEDSRLVGFRYEIPMTGLVLRRVTTTGTKQANAGFYSPLGTYPNVPGATFDSCSFG